MVATMGSTIYNYIIISIITPYGEPMCPKQDEIKQLLIRLPRNVWYFLKLRSAEKECSMNEIINEALEIYKNKKQKKKKKDIDVR